MARAFEELYIVSAKGLQENIIRHNDKHFLQAGQHQFASLWTRDFCWSVPGLLCLKKIGEVKSHLSVLLSSIHPIHHTIPRLLDF